MKDKPTYIPSPEMRTNPLSSIPGGSTVRVVFENYDVHYTDIKHPSAFISKIMADKTRSIIAIYVDGKKVING